MNDFFDDKDVNNISEDGKQNEAYTGQDDEFFGEDTAEDDFQYDITEQKIDIPDIEPSDTVRVNKGLKFFCIVLVCVITLGAFSVGGYMLGRYSVADRKENVTYSQIQLSSKPDGTGISTEKIYADIADSIVGILIYNDEGTVGSASGVVYSESGYIITNDHIYSSIPSAKFKIYLHDGSVYNAYFVAGDTRSDLAVLKISDPVKLAVPDFGDSEEVITGETVCAIGCPNGYNQTSTITSGIVSVPKVRMSITTTYSSNFIQTDTAINPGNSGGALVNSFGQIIGITSSKISGTSYEGVGFAIPTKTVKKVVASLIENGYVDSRSRLGISYLFIDSASAEIEDYEAVGLLVDTVSEDCSLYRQLESGDMITHVNGVPITDDAVLLDMLEDTSPGSTMEFTVLHRSGDSEQMTATLLSDEGSSSYVVYNQEEK